MDHEDSIIVGWYGKIPSLGDFTSRRLPAHFIDTWDSWLQHAIATSRAQLGEHWLNLYLTGPIWRFILMPDVCGNDMWAGILMPSVDKVGRYFPLTVAMQIKPQSGIMLSAISAQTWFAELEKLTLTALNANTLPDDLDRSLAKLPFPSLLSKDKSILARELAAWWQSEPQIGLITHKILSLPTANAMIELFNATTEELLMTAGSGKSIWWAVASETGATRLHCFTGLPPENYFAALLEDVEIK